MSEVGRTTGELVTATEAGAIEVIAAEAAERLAGVCVGWPADRFRALVLDVARVRLHYGIPRAEYESLRREWERRAVATTHELSPPSQLPLGAPGSPAALDRPSSAPT